MFSFIARWYVIVTLTDEAFHADDAKPLETTIENSMMHGYLITFT